MEQVKASDLRLGDIVELFPGAFNHAVVKELSETDITFFRPYGTSADFSCGNRVICYIGLEEFSVPRTHKHEYTVYQRKELA